MQTHHCVPSSRSFLCSALFLIGMILFCWVAASAQDYSINPMDGYTPTGLQSGLPAGSFPLSGFDTINPYNGSVDFSIPLLQVAGRGGASFTIRETWDQTWTGTYSRVDNGMGGVYEFYEPTKGGLAVRPYSPGSLAVRPVNSGSNFCTSYGVDGAYFPQVSLTRLTFLAPDGTQIELRDQLTQGAPATVPTCPTSNFNRGNIFTTADGQAATFISDDDIYDYVPPAFLPDYFYNGINGYLKWKDGTIYRIDLGEVSWIRDRNGNKVSFAYTSSTYTITDSLNRQIIIEQGVTDATYGFCNRIKYKGFGGAQRTIWITMGSMSSALRSGYSIQNLNVLFPFINASNYAVNPTVITAIVLPNGKSYKFYYDSYVEVARVELPTGGAYEYDYGGGLVGGPSTGAICSCQPPQIYRRLLEKRIYSNGGTGSTYDNKMTLSRPEGDGFPGGNEGFVTVNEYNSGGNLITSTKHYYYGGAFQSMLAASEPTNYSGWSEGKEYQTDVFASDGTTLVRRLNTSWAQAYTPGWCSGGGEAPSGDPRVTAVSTTLADTNQVAQQTFSYDQYNNITAVYEYDYGSGAPGSLLRTTLTSYLSINPVNSLDYTSNSIHIRNLPVQRSVYGSTETSRVTFEYDNNATDSNHSALVSRANVSGFDSTFNSSYTPRGNTTSATNYLLSGGSVSGSIPVYSQYDIAGNLVKTIDGRGYATTLEYDDRYGTPDGDATTNPGPTNLGSSTSYAFATRVNRQGQIITIQFDYYLGWPVDIQDVNGINTSNYYDDSMDRPSQVKRAVSTTAASHTVFAYDDTNRIVTTTADLNTNNDGGLISKVLYDQMGRPTETRQYEGGTNYIANQTQYDALGRAYKTSNPFRQTDTPVWTTQAYDGLGRVTSVTTPDSSVTSTSYSGNSVTVTDPAGKLRKSVNDALGRLTSVYEDPSGWNYQTSYAYDALNNMTTVTQGAQTRTFVYDSLKRLTSATNPENGTVVFGYDNNGNLTSRTDARNITTTMIYDSLNRLTSKTYNDSPQTPSVNFYYDAQTLPNGAPTFDRGFSTGRLVAITYGGTSAGTYHGYDQRGRIVRQYQRTDSVNYLVEATYYANSSVHDVIYPSVPGAGDRRTVTYTNDSAGRTASLTTSATTYAPAASVSTISYAPQFAVSSETYGNNLIRAVNYNNRLQPSEIKLGTSGSPTSVMDLVYSYGTTTNNGNVQSIAYAGGGLSYTQTFAYDALNRLTTAQENSGSNWSQTNGYDRYGNRWINLGGGSQSLYFTTTTNRITGWSYDSAGNLLNDTFHAYTYDAENKVSKVDGTVAYVYDGAGQRVRKLVGENTRFIYGIADHLLAEFNGSTGALMKEYVYGPSGLVATIEPTAVNSNGTRYETPDHIGSTRVVANSSAAVVSRHDYMPFGEELGSGVGGRTTGMGFSVADGERHKFTGKERDSETGLDYFCARYFSSTQGRFTGVDPAPLKLNHLLNPQDLNRYAYVSNNPLSFLDPNGEEKIRIIIETFIPQPKVDAPGGRVFQGDDRNVGEPGGFRTQQIITVETDPSKNGGQPEVSYSKDTGVTHELNSNGDVIYQRQASGDSLEYSVTRQGGAVVIQAKADESNPLVSLSPGIGYDLVITVTSQGPQGTATIQVSGAHDGFPGYEITAARIELGTPPVMVYSSDPRKIGATPYNLFPPLDVKVNTTMSLPPPPPPPRLVAPKPPAPQHRKRGKRGRRNDED